MGQICRRAVAALVAVLAMGAVAGVATVQSPKSPTAAARVTAFPSPGDGFAAPTTQLTFRGADAATVARATVTGSRSGAHAGSIRTLSDGRGAIFEPAKPFTQGETVTVDVGTPIRGDADGRYTFRVSTPAQPPATVDTTAMVPVSLQTPADGCTPPTPSYKSRPDLKPIGACAFLDTKQSAPGYLFTASRDVGRGGPTIYTNDGTVVWHKPEALADVQNLQVVTIQGKKRLVYFSGSWLVWEVDSRGVYVILDEHYREIGRIHANDTYRPSLHELQITPEGTALIGSYAPVIMTVRHRPVVVYDYVVQEVDFQHDGAVLFEWHALDHVPVEQSHLPIPGPLGIFDYFHGNAIDVTSDGQLLISSRHAWSIYKVSRTDGHVIWTLGMPNNGPGSFGRTLIGSDLGWFCYQHDAREQADGTITIFDNGGGGPGCKHPARTMTIRLDPAAKTATVVSSFRHDPEINTLFAGNNQVMPNGNHLVSWGDTKRVTEFDPSGKPTLEMSFGQINYRVYRSEWHGYPLTPPDAVIDGSQVRVSWNGATEVAKWQLLGGPTRDALRPIGDPVGKSGFETSIAIPPGTAVVGVEALDAGGKPLAHGRAVAAAGSPHDHPVTAALGKVLGIVLTYTAVGLPLPLALGVALVLGLLFAAVRAVRRKPRRLVVGGFVGVAIGVFLVNATGMPKDFYPPWIFINAVYPIAFLVANLVRWPLVGIVVGFVAGWGTDWRRNPLSMRAFVRAGWIWVGFFALKAAVQLSLYFAGTMVALRIAKVAMGWPMWFLVAWLMYVVVKRSGPRAHWSEAEPATDEPAQDEAQPELAASQGR